MSKFKLDYQPRGWQADCHRQLKRFTVLAVHRRAGKTELAIMELIAQALRCTKQSPLFFYLAPFLKQAKFVAWKRIKTKLKPLIDAGEVEVSEGDLFVRFKRNDAIIQLFGADNDDALRGPGFDGGVVDEVAQIKPDVWYEVLQPTLADRGGWALFIGTVKGINLFSELFFAAAKLDDWHAAKWTVYDTDALPPTEVQRLRDSMPAASFAREFLCDFGAGGDDQLIALVDAEDAAKRLYTAHDLRGAPRILGVDPARFGEDRSVIMRRQGLQAHPPKVFQGIDNMHLARLVAQEIEDYKPHAVFIDAGAGAGVIDRLRQLDYSVVEVPFGGKASEPARFINKRTEMWQHVKEWLDAGGAIPDDRALKQELATPTYKFDHADRYVLESKDKIRERLPTAGSPDVADALALTFAYPVRKRTKIEQAREDYGLPDEEADHDPYADF